MGVQRNESRLKRMWQLYQGRLAFTKIAKRLRRNADTVSGYVQEYGAAVGAASTIIKVEK